MNIENILLKIVPLKFNIPIPASLTLVDEPLMHLFDVYFSNVHDVVKS